MHTYRIKYRDRDPGCPTFTCKVRAYSSDHAVELFHDDGDDWFIISIERI